MKIDRIGDQTGSFLHRFTAAFFAISARRSGVIEDARAAAPLRPISAAPASFPSSTASGTWPVMISTISLPSWTGSRGRGVRFIAIRPIWHVGETGARGRRLGLHCRKLKLTHYPFRRLRRSSHQSLAGRRLAPTPPTPPGPRTAATPLSAHTARRECPRPPRAAAPASRASPRPRPGTRRAVRSPAPDT